MLQQEKYLLKSKNIPENTLVFCDLIKQNDAE